MPSDSEMMTMVAQDRDLAAPAMDYGVMDMVAKQNDPMLLEQATERSICGKPLVSFPNRS